MKLTNLQIYNYAIALTNVFADDQQSLPIKANFYLHKNKSALMALAQELEQTRINIIQTNGALNEETQQYEIPNENISKVNQELADLFALEQEVFIYSVSLDSFGDTSLTTAQMEALMFMIED